MTCRDCDYIMRQMSDARDACLARAVKAEAEAARLRAALACVAASIEVATHRGWHHSQIAAVQQAGETAGRAAGQ